MAELPRERDAVAIGAGNFNARISEDGVTLTRWCLPDGQIGSLSDIVSFTWDEWRVISDRLAGRNRSVTT